MNKSKVDQIVDKWVKKLNSIHKTEQGPIGKSGYHPSTHHYKVVQISKHSKID